jgi:hypothetical protein
MTLHNFKRILQRISIKLIRLLDMEKQGINYSQYEMEAFHICKTLIKKPETVLLMSNSGKKYIKSDDSEIFIIITNDDITIINHSYSYNISLKGKAYFRIINLFNDEIEKRRMDMENEIRSNIKHSLNMIYKSLKDENV